MNTLVIELRKRIDELEVRAAESALIADLATDPDARAYNARLAQNLREYIARLRQQLDAAPTADEQRHAES